MKRDLFLGALLAGGVDAAEREYPVLFESDDQGGAAHGPVFCSAVLAMEDGDHAGAISLLDGVRSVNRSDSVFTFLRAEALASTDPPRLQDARNELALSEASEGDGQVLPFAVLRSFIDSREGAKTPDTPTIRAALERQRQAAQKNMVDWYFLRVAERLARKSGVESLDL